MCTSCPLRSTVAGFRYLDLVPAIPEIPGTVVHSACLVTDIGRILSLAITDFLALSFDSRPDIMGFLHSWEKC